MTTSSEPASKRSRSADPIVEAARQHFAVSYLYPIQRFVISNILEEKNQIVVLPTGAGKSLCYQLPARICSGSTIVVVPLLSLLEDQIGRCRSAGLKAEALRGGQRRETRRRLTDELCSGQIDLLFTTPETLQTISAAGLFAGTEIAHLVVDEAHCVCEWGESFRPAYLKLDRAIGKLKPRCLTAFTATASPRILESIQNVLFNEQGATILSTDPDRPNIRYSVIPTLSKIRSLLHLVDASPRPLLVFTRTRSSAELAARTIRRRFPNLPTYFYHAGLNREERIRIEAWYKPSGDGILTATSAYGLGVDKPDIRTVIHLDVPYSPEAYLQETGRAGRDGSPVEATLLYSSEDLGFADTLSAASGTLPVDSHGATRPAPLAAQRYVQMLGYALDTEHCRREQLLRFLGREAESCSGCDVCDGRVLTRAEGEAQILEVVSRHRRRFTLLQIVQLLRGAKSYEVVRSGLASYQGFGSLTGWQEEEIEEALESLRRSGAIKVLKRGYWKDRITS
ncbi:MAG: ATP-dependent DNA helicase RecQ [Spirochaetaceae bacterium]|nr:MAG: ATP-dependent DNA helicase RecQ [Spirochaetaceae bacterium]